MEKMSMSVRIKLSVMMFVQFMSFAVWWVPLAAYLTNIGVGSKFVPLIMSTMAFGCMAAPVIGMFADRHFASQKILAVLNIATAVLLFVASTQTNSMALFIVLLVAMLCYMPTWALTSSIAMSNSPAEKFPQIRVFGSIGWVAAALFSIVALKFFGAKIDGTKIPLICGAVLSLIAAGINFTVPNTPPPAKGQKASVIDALGLRAVSMMKDKNFAIFIVISTLVMIPFTLYFSFYSIFLQDKGFTLITPTMNLGQAAEIFLMLLIPLALARMGIKWALVAGLIALVVRYIAFWCGGLFDMTWLYFIGILVHGVIFGFFIVGGQIYVDKKASPEIRAQAQGFMFLVTFGVGMVLGNFFSSYLIDSYSTITEPVVENYTMPDTVNDDMLTVENAVVDNVRFYDKALSGIEIEMLNAVITENQVTIDRLNKEAGVGTEVGDGSVVYSIDQSKSALFSGDLAGLPGEKAAEQMTFSAMVYLPVEEGLAEDAKPAPLTGTIFAMGGDSSIKVGVKDDLLYFSAGEKEIVQRIAMPRGEDKNGNPQKVFVTATFDGKDLRLYTQGKIYRRYDWDPIWKITTIISAILLGAFIVLFRDKFDKPGKEAVKEAVTEVAEEEIV